MNNPLATLPQRAAQLAGSVKHVVPSKAMQWIETGAAVAAMKTGGRVVTRAVRRNPAVAAAAVVGAGLLWLAARRHAKRRELDETTDGKTRRIEARRAPRTRKATTKS
ncbi:MAG: hypothetical protein ABIR05_05135 [Luteimonas sp.]